MVKRYLRLLESHRYNSYYRLGHHSCRAWNVRILRLLHPYASERNLLRAFLLLFLQKEAAAGVVG